jgi:2-amino-4-hydroxy-6-hydroxymethyldihydropteridine diphosphokinase
MAQSVYLSLGTNLGERLANLQAARDALQAGLTLRQASSIYETEPWGYIEQPPFLNQVVEMETSAFSPLELLHFLKKLETSVGREPSFHYGPRLIDVDILYYDATIMNTTELIIPHPHLAERAFVLAPLAEIAPDFCHPLLHATSLELLQKVDRKGVKLYQT